MNKDELNETISYCQLYMTRGKWTTSTSIYYYIL